MLEVSDLHVHYGRLHVIRGMSLRVLHDEIVTVLGPNGAGKTTLLHTVSGLVQASGGRISFNGTEVRGCEPNQVVAAGIVHVPQGRQLFPAMTVHENLEMGAFVSGAMDNLELVYTLFPRLKERVRQVAGTLSGGEAQMVAIGRGLMARPKLLMLDEPSLGLAPLLVRELQEVIKSINRNQKVMVLLVEQNARMALDIAGRAYVLQLGKVFLEDSAEEIKKGEYVRKAYLG